jgi:hypothetical protein
MPSDVITLSSGDATESTVSSFRNTVTSEGWFAGPGGNVLKEAAKELGTNDVVVEDDDDVGVVVGGGGAEVVVVATEVVAVSSAGPLGVFVSQARSAPDTRTPATSSLRIAVALSNPGLGTSSFPRTQNVQSSPITGVK